MKSIQNYSRSLLVTIAAGDMLIAVGSYVFSFWIRSHSSLFLFEATIPFSRFMRDYNHHFVLLLGIQVFFLYSFGLYDRLMRPRFIEMIRFTSSAVSLQVLVFIAYYYLSNDINFPRSIFVVFWLVDIAAISGWRILLARILKLKGVKRRVLFVGASSVTAELIEEVERLSTIGLEIIGIVRKEGDPEQVSFRGYRVLGDQHDLPHLIEKYDINEVIITPHQSWQDRIISDITRSDTSQARVSIVPSMYEILISKMHHLKIYDIPLVEVIREPTPEITWIGKKVMDYFFALIGLAFMLLLLPFIVVIMKATSPGPIFYRQERVGLNGKPFRLYKFRTMIVDAEKASGPVFCSPTDDRITGVGGFLRRWRIDELPQFFNVLRGDMSLVGPRPERPFFVEQFNRDIKGYSLRFKIKPGMTGLAQVNGSNQIIPENKLRYDLAYIYNQSLWLDVLIILETIKVIMTGRVP